MESPPTDQVLSKSVSMENLAPLALTGRGKGKSETNADQKGIKLTQQSLASLGLRAGTTSGAPWPRGPRDSSPARSTASSSHSRKASRATAKAVLAEGLLASWEGQMVDDPEKSILFIQVAGWEDLQELLETKKITRTTLAVIIDPFDRSEEREDLLSVLSISHPNAYLSVPSGAQDPLRRLVREYSLEEDGKYQYSRRAPIALADYLVRKGYSVSMKGGVVLPAAPAEDNIRPNAYFGSMRKSTSFTTLTEQTTNHILMVSPTAFGSNPETAVDNHYMKKPEGTVSATARKEFQTLHKALTDKGIDVHLFTHEDEHNTPDACFPNNWFSTHHNFETDVTTLVLYPMKSLRRRAERRSEMVEMLKQTYTVVLDLTGFERLNKYLEGTGSLILDRQRRVAYVGISERAHEDVIRMWALRMNYSVVKFHASDKEGRIIYHTNVMMGLGTKCVVVCLEAVKDEEERKNLETELAKSHVIVEITLDQVSNFCGNVLEAENNKGRRYMCMSQRAFNNFTPAQRALMQTCVDGFIFADISTIEDVGGGSVRCTMGELF